MSRSYNPANKSDMKKFKRDMERIALEKAQNILREREQAVGGFPARLPIQRMQCPKCSQTNDIYSLNPLDLPIRCRVCGYELVKWPDAGTDGANGEEST